MKKITCDWCGGNGQDMTDCGMESCDHCGGTGKIKFTKSAIIHYYGFDGYEAMGLKLIIPTPMKVTCGMNMFNRDKYGDRPLMSISEVIIK